MKLKKNVVIFQNFRTEFIASRGYEQATNHRPKLYLSSCSVKVSHLARPGWRTRVGSTDDASKNRWLLINGWFSKAKVSSSSSTFLPPQPRSVHDESLYLRECRLHAQRYNIVQCVHLKDSDRGSSPRKPASVKDTPVASRVSPFVERSSSSPLRDGAIVVVIVFSWCNSESGTAIATTIAVSSAWFLVSSVIQWGYTCAYRWLEQPDAEMHRKMHWIYVSLAVLAGLLAGAEPSNRYKQQAEQQSSIYYTEPTMLMNTSGRTTDNNGNGVTLTELHDGRIVRGQKLLKRSKSPYLLREDLYVESDGELVLEPGVEIRFGPMVGITVRGVITAQVIIHQNCNSKVETSTR